MNKIRQLLAFAVIVGGISLSIVLFLRVDKRTGPVEPAPRLPGNVDMSLKQIHFTETRNGVKKWDLLADRTDYDKGREVAHLTGVRLVVTGDRATGDVTLTADKADYHIKMRDVQLSGNVAARSDSGMKFTTEEATFHAARELIRASGRVKYSDIRMNVEGVGMEFSTQTLNLRISRDVTASVRGEGRP